MKSLYPNFLEYSHEKAVEMILQLSTQNINLDKGRDNTFYEDYSWEVKILLSYFRFRILNNLYIFVTNVYNLLFFIGVSFIF